MREDIWRSGLGVLLLALSLGLILAAGPARSQPVLNELLADPASDWDSDGDWDVIGQVGSKYRSGPAVYENTGTNAAPRFKQAGRGGIGTVFRDKRIKALVVKSPPVKGDSNHPTDRARIAAALGAGGGNMDDLMDKADRIALYQAKSLGKNRVIMYQDTVS